MTGIISLKRDVLSHKTSLNPPFLLKFRNQTRKVRGHVYVLKVSILSVFIRCFSQKIIQERQGNTYMRISLELSSVRILTTGSNNSQDGHDRFTGCLDMEPKSQLF